MDIEIYTSDNNLLFNLMGKLPVPEGDEIQVADQVKLRYEETEFLRALGPSDIFKFVLTFGSSVAAGVAANWLYDKLKGKRIEKLLIERTEVEIDKEEIKKIIEEKLKIEKH